MLFIRSHEAKTDQNRYKSFKRKKKLKAVTLQDDPLIREIVTLGNFSTWVIKKETLLKKIKLNSAKCKSIKIYLRYSLNMPGVRLASGSVTLIVYESSIIEN